MFEGKTIFLTGSTGFLGKMMLEKLLRSCFSLKRVYILLRPKKNKGMKERFDELFEGPMWEPLKKINENFKRKVFPIGGDLQLPDLGISDENLKILKNEVNIIMHIGATVRFDEKIKLAAFINVRAVKILVEIAKKTENFEAFLYVSTAFSHSVRKNIDEEFYETPLSAKQLLCLVETLDEETLSTITPKLLNDWPNTYSFTKAIAENLLKDESGNFPIIICRPSAVTGAVSEPLPGWIDSFYGYGGMILANGLGILRCFRGNEEKNLEIIPADYSINCMIVAVAEMCKKRSVFNSIDREMRKEQFTKIYNSCCSPQVLMNMGKLARLTEKFGAEMPYKQAFWVVMIRFRHIIILHKLAVFFLHTVPAYLIDFFLILMRKQPQAVAIYSKIEATIVVLAYYTLREWNFRNENVQQLWNNLDLKDRKIFPFSMENFDYKRYWWTFLIGVRMYLAKESMETVPEGKRRRKFFIVLHYSIIVGVVCIIFFLSKFIFRLIM